MKPKALTRETLDEFKSRVNNLTPESERIFGTMDSVAMLRHMRNVIETGLEEATQPNKTIPIIGPTLGFVLCNIITTWPGGKLKVDDFWTPPADQSFEKERELIMAAMQRLTEKIVNEPNKKVQHPFFGKMTMTGWGQGVGVHFHHHLRQFSV